MLCSTHCPLRGVLSDRCPPAQLLPGGNEKRSRKLPSPPWPFVLVISIMEHALGDRRLVPSHTHEKSLPRFHSIIKIIK